MKKALLDYDEIRRMFDEKYRATKRLIRNGETHLDNLAEGFAEADQVIWKLFFDADKPQTNADRIRAMSDEELAESISSFIFDVNEGAAYSENPNSWLEWLQQPAEVE